MNEDHDVLVITVTRNKLPVAQQTIPHLKSLTNRPFHYAVVANGDLEAGKWLIDNKDKGWYDSLAVVSENMGVGPGYNLFWRHFIRFNKNLSYVVKFDDSNRPMRKDWLDELIRLADYYKGLAGMVAYLIEDNDFEWPVQTIEGWPVRPTPLNCSGSCCLISRSTWEHIGLWDEEILGWLPNDSAEEKVPIFYAREDGMMGHLCLHVGLQNIYHSELGVIQCIQKKTESPEYAQWKRNQYSRALPQQIAVIQEFLKQRRTLPHRPPI